LASSLGFQGIVVVMTRWTDPEPATIGEEGQVMSWFRSRRNGQARLVRVIALGWLVGSLGLLGLLGGTVRAQFPGRSASTFKPDASNTAELLLRNAANLVRDRQWSEAIEIYQRVLEQFGEKVAKLPSGEPGVDGSGDFALYLDDRRFCHRSIAHLPPEAREIYRNRVDGVAERWFRQGASQRDVGSLRRVVDLAFCSSWGDDALELLGDLAFQDGRFGEALAMYNRLVSDHAEDPLALVHPDPTVDLARVAAKKLLCQAAAGEKPPGPAELDLYTRRFPGASGSLAGRKGSYAQILAECLTVDRLAAPAQPDSRWPTFAGSLRRSKVVAGPIDVGSLQWRVDVEKVSVNSRPPYFRGGGSAANAPPERLLAFHPIVLGDQVLVCDGTQVLAYNLSDRASDADGNAPRLIEPAWKHPADDGGQVPQARHPTLGIPRYTLTAVGHRIYARMGMSAPFVPGLGGMASRGTTSIIALDWNTQGKLVWEQKSTSLSLPNRPPERNNGNRTVSFEGTPVADARNVYVAVTDRREQTETYVACFDAETGASRWVRYLGTSSDVNNFGGMGLPMPFAVSAAGDFNHRLLSLDGPTLFYQTNLGALIALEAETGATVWVATYPRQELVRQENGSERDLNPAVIHEGRVFVAPSDADAIFAFDAANGRFLWRTDRISDDVKLSHLLGVAKNRLVATGNRVLLFDVESGRLLHAWPDSGKSLEGHGRGLLAGDLIYWPTQNEIEVLDQRTALRAEPPIRLLETYHTKGGNLVAGDGYLIVAQADGLVVFCQNSRLIERYREDIVRAPDQAVNYFRLARAAEAVGQDQLALDSFEQASQKARSDETVDGIPLGGAARDHRFRLLVRLAGQARRARRWDEAAKELETAGTVARSDAERLLAQLQLADVFLDAARPRDAVNICERILSDERLRPLAVSTIDGHRTVRADLMIADRLKTIVRAHGRTVYEPYDKAAALLFERGKKEKDPRALDEVVRAYPQARVAPDALLELGSLYESSGHLTDAAHAYKRLLFLAQDDEHRALASWRLAHVYEARKLFLAARDSFLDLQARFPKMRLTDGEKPAPVSELVAAELARAPYAELLGDVPQPPIPVPLVRRWSWPAPASHPTGLLSASGVTPSAEMGRVFLLEKAALRLLDPATGSPRWSAEIGAPAVWAGYLSDKLIAATPRQIVALELSQGAVQWSYDLLRSGKDTKGPDPFGNANPGEPNERRDRSGETIAGFQLVKGRVFCLRGRRELIALDGDTGALDWSFSAPPGEINPNLWIGDDRIVLQIDKPNQLLVLRTDDGQPISRSALAETDMLERPPLPLDEDSVVLVADKRTIKRFDIKHGHTMWDYQESKVLPVNGPPRLLGDSDRLLVLHDGRLLYRLDPATGSKRWSSPLGSEDLSERPDAMVCDEKSFYCVNIENIFGGMRQVLRAISLEDGSRQWSCHLAGPQDAVWAVALSKRCVIAYPRSARPADGAGIDNMPVILRRRETGALVQRFVFPTTIADVKFRVDSRGALLATSRGLWSLGSKEPSDSPLSERAR
jgi:outer membrane protein assembly factor BamB/tetratricopeptide (TPR) repeat protein